MRLLRDILGLGLVGFLSSCSLNSNFKEDDLELIVSEQKISEANKCLREFPDYIPGAREIRKYKTPDAELCFVHILEYHWRERGKESREDYENSLRKINMIQRNVWHILDYLNKNYGFTEIISEGDVKKVSREESKEYIMGLLGHIRSQGFLQDEFRKEDKTGFLFIPGAVRWMSSLERMKVLPGEDVECYKKATNMNFVGKGINKFILDDREDFVLKKASEFCENSGKYIVLVDFGAMHAFGGNTSFKNYNSNGRYSFKDNIAKFEKKVSLIEVVPRSYVFSD